VSGALLPQLRWLDTVGGAHMVGYGDVSTDTSCSASLPAPMPRLSPLSAVAARLRQRECPRGIVELRWRRQAPLQAHCR
jgi:hypothetical protein